MKKLSINMLIILAALTLAIGTCGFTLVSKHNADAALVKETKKAKDKLTEKNKLEKKVKKMQEKLEESVVGVSAETRAGDYSTIKSYMRPVFTWSSGKEYDSMRAGLINELGADSQFVKTYIPENIHIKVTGDQADNDIDINERNSEMQSIDLYPTTWKANGDVSYIVVVTYQPYIKKVDLNAEGMTKSQAFIELTMVNSDSGRKVTDVKGYAGIEDN